MEIEHWCTAMDGTDDNQETEKEETEKEETEKNEKDKQKEKTDGFETPTGSPKATPRGEGETRTPDDPFCHTPPFALSIYSTPRSSPGTPGKLPVVTEGTP